MKYLLFAPIRTAAFVPHFHSIVMDNAEKYVRKGHQVDILFCDGKAINICFYNAYGDRNVCKSCNQYRKYIYSHLDSRVKQRPISDFFDFTKNYDEITFSYKSVAEIKKIQYKNVMVGYAALSTYLTITRNLRPRINDEFIHYFDGLLRSACKLTDIVLASQNFFEPDISGVFNSRMICCRPVVDTCQNERRDFISFEASWNLQGRLVKRSFFNATPHNVEYNTCVINKMWEDCSVVSIEEKEKIASVFFEKRRNAIAAGDKIYVKDQIKGKLPPDWNPDKHNVVIFNSSEDEFASLGEEFEAMSLFPSQFDGIKYLVEKFKKNKDIHFYLRIHPNLRSVEYSYHKQLYKFNEYTNITVIAADSDVNTYALVDYADKVLVFGSTTGAEAVYAGKPVILMGCSMYRNLDFCYVPTNKDELSNLIEDKHLVVKNQKNALKFGYYIMNDEFDFFEFFTDNNKRTIRFIKSFIITRCELKKSKLSVLIGYLYQIYGKYIWSKSNYSVPIEEESVF